MAVHGLGYNALAKLGLKFGNYAAKNASCRMAISNAWEIHVYPGLLKIPALPIEKRSYGQWAGESRHQPRRNYLGGGRPSCQLYAKLLQEGYII